MNLVKYRKGLQTGCDHGGNQIGNSTDSVIMEFVVLSNKGSEICCFSSSSSFTDTRSEWLNESCW